MQILDDQESRLEQLLRLATQEPAHRPEFCQILMASPLFVLGEAGELEGEFELQAGSDISLQHWQREDGSEFIPVFTSLEAMQHCVESDEPYLELPAELLFEMTLGSVLVLNPEAEYSKEFLPQEIEALLQNGLSSVTTEYLVDDDRELSISEPQPYPAPLVDSLTTFFSKHASVEAAYIGMMEDERESEPASLLIGLSGTGELGDIIQQAAAVAWDVTDDEDIVDFMVLEAGDGGISDYFLNEAKPFYERRWGAKMEPYQEPGKA